MPVLSGELRPAVETSFEVTFHLVLHPLDGKAVGVLDRSANVFAAKEMGLLRWLTHVNSAELRVIRVTHDVRPKLGFKFRWAGHLKS